ncbi:cyclophilin type peptidyl-prolyl cis-trans isomerase/CLD domain-containing protein [Ditylenchus destructor]|uniref:Spliceosome-associated protein CWC27 homolog n=1 Tax=Ditylenchus destructor TaxID=166010 RepID=A0AAD4N7K5_9BILA|nr:cyclophilin type peptidyl-prolyl cis-trans isomerase/CLD domain-containing protein [Ditylenchus destructor]
MSNIYITEPPTNGKVCLNTTLGDIEIELWSKECPQTCRNFIQLCMEGYYDGCIFHRLVKDFIVQTGDPTGTGHGGESIYGDYFKSEFHQRLKFNRRGLLGMAGEKKDQNGSQFFFTLGPTNELTGKHTLFGKIEGKTLYNMLRLNEYHDVDANERPTYVNKITGAKILSNPFPDIKPRRDRERESKEARRERKKDKEPTKVITKQTNLLSFGDEAEEDEQEIEAINKKIKSKSAHDVLEDEVLSKDAAVKPDELGVYEEDETDKNDRLDRVKERLKAKKRKVDFDEPADDDDLEKMIDEEKEFMKKAELEKAQEELRQLQKDYKKATRVPKEPTVVDEDATATEGMKSYKKMKLKFKSGSKGIVKSVNPKREEQTMSLLERFQTKLNRASVQGILLDKKVDMSDIRTQEEIIMATSEDQGKIDLDANDVEGEEWMVHQLVAPVETTTNEQNKSLGITGVSKARDANMKDTDDDWYPIDDPRNRMNIRKREKDIE